MIDLLLSGAELLAVEGEFRALEDVPIGTSALSGAGGDGSEKTSALEEIGELRAQFSLGSALGELLLDVLALLDVLLVVTVLLSLLLSEGDSVVSLIPLLERSGVNQDDGVLDKSLGAHKLVVGGVVNDVKDTGLARHGFATPRKVSCIEAHGTELSVSSTATNDVDTLGSDLSHGRRASHHKLSLLADRLALSTSVAPLVHGVTRESHRI